MPTPPKRLAAAVDDRLTVEEVIELELAFILNSIYRMGVSRSDVPDVAQEVFLAIHSSFSTFDQSKELRPWLHGIVWRQAQSHFRSRARRRDHLEEPSTFAQPPLDPEARMIQDQDGAQIRQLVQEILDTLDLERRGILVAVDLLDLTVAQAAEAAGIPLNTAKSRLRLAREDFERGWRRRRPTLGQRGLAVLPMSAQALLAHDGYVTPLEAGEKERLMGRLSSAMTVAVPGASPPPTAAPPASPSSAAARALTPVTSHLLVAGTGAMAGALLVLAFSAVALHARPKPAIAELAFPPTLTRDLPASSSTVALPDLPDPPPQRADAGGASPEGGAVHARGRTTHPQRRPGRPGVGRSRRGA